MRLGLGSGVRARRSVTALSVALACGVAVMAGTWGGARDQDDAWTRLVEAGDWDGAAVDSPLAGGGPRLSARQAYLLAFHQAQDAADPEHVLAVADRLEGIGEGALASHVRRAARILLAELGFGHDAAEEDTPP
jgi:hypothetical protein